MKTTKTTKNTDIVNRLMSEKSELESRIASIKIKNDKEMLLLINKVNSKDKLIIELQENLVCEENQIIELMMEKAELERCIVALNDKSFRREQEVITLCVGCKNDKQKQAVEICENCKHRNNAIKWAGLDSVADNLYKENEKLRKENDNLTSNLPSTNQFNVDANIEAMRLINEALRQENQGLRESMRKNEEIIRGLNAIKKFFTETN